ncbi:MAG TPA: hypothetical protein VLA72_20805 [Anaerolineales bacterium]|nr:hypothetical protein [Anaerolineales bacterium]
MPDVKGEMHGCIVCGKLYQLYVAYDADGKYIGSKVMSAGGREVKDVNRPLVACETHGDEDIERAIKRVFGSYDNEDE